MNNIECALPCNTLRTIEHFANPKEYLLMLCANMILPHVSRVTMLCMSMSLELLCLRKLTKKPYNLKGKML